MALLNPNLKGFFETKNIRNYVLYGGRASSKTYHTAGFCVYLACNYKVKFLCVRQFQNRISDSVKTVIEECIYTAKLENEFVITENEVRHKKTGSTFNFFGIQRNLKEIKGIAGIDVLWVEEAEDLSPGQWEILEPTIRSEGSVVFIVFNPRLASDFVYQNFVLNPPNKTLVRKINYDENPFLSQTMRELIEEHKRTNYDDYLHIYEGVPRIDDESVIIKMSWIEAAVNAHLKLEFEPEGAKRLGFDVADSGQDKCANVYAHGSVALWADEWQGGEDKLLQSCSRTYNNAKERNAHIRYDSIGVGAGCGSKFDELNQNRHDYVPYSKFNAGGAVFNPDGYYAIDRMDKVKNKDQFSNIKAQAWWLVADRFRNTYDAVMNGTKYNVDELISISSDMPHLAKLKAELSTPKRDFDANGRVKVESKKDLDKREIPSPNLADAFIMCFAPEHKPMSIDKSIFQMMGKR